MSAYIVDTDKMNEIVNVIAQFRKVFGGHDLTETRQVMIVVGSTNDNRTALGNTLFAMNADAVRQRYGRDDDYSTPPDYIYRQTVPASMTPRDMCRRIKAIRCLLYQCLEGDVDESQLYKDLEAFNTELAWELVLALPEYNAAPW